MYYHKIKYNKTGHKENIDIIYKMPNYHNGIIYKLCCNDLSIKDIYIGSTTSFRKRKYAHKNSCNNIKSKNYNSKVYKFIRDNGGFKNWCMILIAETPCNSKIELNKHERYYYEKFSASLNINYPARTHKEYREDNKDKYKKYRDDNKDKSKKYKEDNKDKIKIKSKKYYEDNKDKIKKYREDNKYKICCEFCNKMISKLNITRHHKNTKKCLLIQKQNKNSKTK